MDLNTQHQQYQAKQAARKFTASQLAQAFPYLVQGSGPVTAAKNIRIELKRAYPAVKFSVRTSKYSMGNSIDISWTDGPNSEQVEQITNKYQGGSFDGMTDCYNYEDSAWTDAFGEGKYIFCRRDYSDKMVEGCIRRVCNHLGGIETVPTVEDYRQGRVRFVKQSGGCDVEREINIALSRLTYCIAKVPA